MSISLHYRSCIDLHDISVDLLFTELKYRYYKSNIY